ncbi:MAG: hypothetical protein V8R50_03570 [Clostridia bacterium]
MNGNIRRKADEQGRDAAMMVFFLNWMHDHLTEKELQAAVDRREKQEQETEGPLEIVIDLADLGYGDNEDYADHVSDGDDDWDRMMTTGPGRWRRLGNRGSG